MAEEMIDIPATPEPEKSVVEDDHTRRNSTGNLSMNEVKVLPRYLSAKVDSCHDYCKYGIKHILEKRARIPIRKRIAAKLGQGECQYQVEVVILEAKKKKSLISTKPLADSKGQTTDKHEVIEREALVPAKKIAASSKPLFSPGAPGDRINVSAKYASDLRPKPVQTTPSSFSTPGRLSTRRYSDILPVQIKPSFSTPGRLSSRRYSEILPQKGTGGLQASPVGGSSSRRHSDTGISKEIRTSKLRKKNNSMPPTISPSPRPSIKRELTARSGHYKEPKQVSHLRSQRSVRKAQPKQPIDEKVPEKTLYVIETKPVNPIVGVTKNGNGTTHSSWSPSQSSKVKKLERRQHGMQTSQSPSSTESKKLRHTRNGIHITQSSSSSSLSSENKRLRRTKKGNRNASSCSSSLSLLLSSSSVSECMKSDKSDPIPEGSGSKTENQIANHSSRPRRVVRVISEGKVRSPQKLNFTRGKVVDVQPKNNSPRILRFKQRRVLGENQSGKADIKQRSFKKVVATADLNGSETKPTNVVLRHQAVEGKKGAQSLLNNVIEETASKLVETRKSKVKALVGAFETVISLQDTKSSATTSAS